MNELKHELQNILSGKSSNGAGGFISTIVHYLAGSKTPSATPEKKQFNKEWEEEKLIRFIEQNELWYNLPLNEHLKIG